MKKVQKQLSKTKSFQISPPGIGFPFGGEGNFSSKPLTNLLSENYFSTESDCTRKRRRTGLNGYMKRVLESRASATIDPPLCPTLAVGVSRQGR